MEIDSQYLCWQGVPSKQAYSVYRWDDALRKRTDGHDLNRNVDTPLADQWPASPFCLVDRDLYPKKAILQDHIFNAENLLVISGRLRKCLEAAHVTDIEYLPVRVIDPTGLLLDDAYSIAHTLKSPDCLDLAASGAKRSRVIPSKAEKIERIVLSQDPKRSLFRPATFQKITLVSWALAERIAAEGFTGFRFMGLFDYGIADLPPNPKRKRVDALCSQLVKNAQARMPKMS